MTEGRTATTADGNGVIGVIDAIDAALLPSTLRHGLRLHHTSISGERLLPLVRCRADNSVGYGEAPPLVTFTGEDAGGTVDQLRSFAPRLLGLTPDEALERIHRPGAALSGPARAAFDIALHDLISRKHDAPLHQLLGNAVTQSVRITRAIGFHDLDKTVELSRGYLDLGISALKLKVGRDTETDASVIRAVRKAAGAEVEISIDANEGFSADEALALVEACRDYDLAYFEQPVPRHDRAGLRRVRESGVLVMADESLFDAEDARQLIAAEAADLFAIKLIKCGGLRPALEIVRVAREHGVPVVVIDPLGSAVSLNAGLHLAAILEESGYAHGLSAGLDVNAPHAPHLAVVDGAVQVPPRAGLGVEVQWQA